MNAPPARPLSQREPSPGHGRNYLGSQRSSSILLSAKGSMRGHIFVGTACRLSSPNQVAQQSVG